MRAPTSRTLAGLALAVLATALPAGCSTTPASNLSTGDCYDSRGEVSTGGDVTRVEKVQCSTPHDAEVVGTHALPEGPFPGRDALVETASEVCPPLFAQYTGREYDRDAPETLVPMLPAENGWDAGPQSILCVARLPEPGTQSIRG